MGELLSIGLHFPSNNCGFLHQFMGIPEIGTSLTGLGGAIAAVGTGSLDKRIYCGSGVSVELGHSWVIIVRINFYVLIAHIKVFVAYPNIACWR